MTKVRVVVSGSRSWDRPDVIESCLDIVANEAAAAGIERMVVVHGCALGADMHADRWTRKHGHPLEVTVERHPANWQKHKRRAGYLRNVAMLASGCDLVLAFIRDKSKGASMLADLAEAAEIPVQRLDYDSLPLEMP